MSTNNWFKVNDESKILTPGLIIYPERIEHNIKSMISISGDVNRLIPHVKTYKMPSVVKLQMDYGIKEFKCATFGELEMLISCKVKHILLAIQPTKEKAIRFLNLQKKYPKIKFILSKENIGYGRGNNLILKICKTPYLLILSPDTILKKDCFLSGRLPQKIDTGIIEISL